MALLPRYSVSILVVLAASLAIFTVLTFARPQYHPQYESKMIDFSKQRYYAGATVRKAFAAQQIRLYAFDGPATAWTGFSNEPAAFADALNVMVAPRAGKGSWGPRLEPYDERFGNVLVTYGGHDEDLLQAVKAAVASLR